MMLKSLPIADGDMVVWWFHDILILQLECQLEKSNKSASELRRKYRSFQKQIKLVVDEKAELQAQIQEQERELQILKERLGTAVKENEDLSQKSVSIVRIGFACDETKCICRQCRFSICYRQKMYPILDIIPMTQIGRGSPCRRSRGSSTKETSSRPSCARYKMSWSSGDESTLVQSGKADYCIWALSWDVNLSLYI